MKPKGSRVPAAAGLLMVAAVLGGVLWFGLAHAQWSASRSSSGLVNAGPAAEPGVITVDSTADAVDANPGDGTCGTAAGDCTLRAAVQEANALAGPETISLPPDTYALSIAGANEDAAATGDLDMTDDLTMTGAGQAITIIDGGGLDRVFHVHPGNIVDISGVTVRNGVVGGWGHGGGILNSGTLRATNSTVTGNSAEYGGGITSDGHLGITSSTVSANSGWIGGGIENLGGTVTLSEVAVSGNDAHTVAGITNSGALTMTNSTVSGNVAFTVGGIGNSGTATLNGVTITGNMCWTSGIYNTGTVTLNNTVVANNSPADCSGDPVSSAGHNLDSDGSCSLGAAGDLSNTDPLLGPLQDNGGPTLTHALLAGSPAIDAGDNTDCPASDQRGFARPVDGDGDGSAICDIGAYEFERESIAVDIDIKPGGDPNSTNLGSRGVIPVAILTTPDFDAASVDPATVAFEGAPPVHDALEDVDGDGDLDLIMHFRTQDAEITDDATEACLTGETFDGQPIEGCDTIRIVPPSLDSDGDDFGDAVEATMGTDQSAACPTSPGHDAWPPDFNDDQVVNLLDLNKMLPPPLGSWGATPGDPAYSVRRDLVPDGVINLPDLNKVLPAPLGSWGQTCTP